MNDAKALDAELTGLVYDSEVTIVDEDGVWRDASGTGSCL